MQITEVESLVIGNLHFVRLRTDGGLVGLGQSACWAYPEAVHRVVLTFREYLIGQDPLRIEQHWQHLYRMGPFRDAITSAAISAVDMALWDIKGKHLDVPIWQLLGGYCRTRIRLALLILGAHTPETIAVRFSSAIEEGYTAIKFDPFPRGYQDMGLAELVSRITSIVSAARDVAGDRADIILEFHRSVGPLHALTLIEAVKIFHPLFVEDPIQIDSISSQADIARRLNVPIGLGERLQSIWEFREQLDQAGPVYVRADLGLAGGITHCKKIASIAESYHAIPVWHNWLGPLITAASVHLDIAIPNFLVQEYCPEADEGDGACGFKTAIRREGGYLLPPEAPGLGVDLDEGKVKRSDILGRPLWQIPLRSDGSVAFSV